jgi:hypothetical protein
MWRLVLISFGKERLPNVGIAWVYGGQIKARQLFYLL